MIKVFQLKGSRGALNIGVRDIGAFLGCSRTTISNLEKKSLLSDIQITEHQNSLLSRLFKDHGIIFPNQNEIKLVTEQINSDKEIRRFHLRGARNILGISQEELSNTLSIKKSTLNALEALDNQEFINSHIQRKFISQAYIFFKKHGIFFSNSNTILVKEVDTQCQE